MSGCIWTVFVLSTIQRISEYYKAATFVLILALSPEITTSTPLLLPLPTPSHLHSDSSFRILRILLPAYTHDVNVISNVFPIIRIYIYFVLLQQNPLCGNGLFPSVEGK